MGGRAGPLGLVPSGLPASPGGVGTGGGPTALASCARSSQSGCDERGHKGSCGLRVGGPLGACLWDPSVARGPPAVRSICLPSGSCSHFRRAAHAASAHQASLPAGQVGPSRRLLEVEWPFVGPSSATELASRHHRGHPACGDSPWPHPPWPLRWLCAHGVRVPGGVLSSLTAPSLHLGFSRGGCHFWWPPNLSTVVSAE